MIKILQILPSHSPGIDELAQSIVNSFPETDFEVITAYLNPTLNKSALSKNKYFNFKKKETQGLRLKALWEVYKYCRKEKFDVVITHRFKPLYLILILNIFLKIPTCISVIHGFDDFSRSYRRLLLKLFWTKQWHFVAISDAVGNYLARISSNIDGQQITIINNAINVSALSDSLLEKKQSRRHLNLPPDDLIFGTIGRLIPLKGHHQLIKAFKDVLQKHPSSHLVIIGEGRSRQELESSINTLGLQNNVTLTGHIDNASSYLKGFDVFILPSLKEGFGMVLLEAMTAKLPIIASHTGGVPHVLGELGELVQPKGYPKSLSKKMTEQAQLTPNQRDEIGNALYERLLKNFDEPDYQKKWSELITRRN